LKDDGIGAGRRLTHIYPQVAMEAHVFLLRWKPMSSRWWVRAVIALLTGIGALAGVAHADQRDGRLDGLFARLRSTASASEAKAIEERIWGIWSEAGDPRIDLLLQEGVLAMSAADFPVALERFDRMVEQAPDFAEGWNKRATLYYLMGDFRASVRDIQRTLDLEPRHFGALSGLGLIYDAVDQPAAALRSFEAAVAINPHLESIEQRIQELRRQLAGRPT
jgi:tetratricopeptide (TPR) repeat protein